jgi:putative DNA primase/helicase
VSLPETERDVQLKESIVKQITGQDTINARRPFGRPFTYRPQFKLWMSTNHKPEIPDGSEAIWDRLRLIPFTQRFVGKDADTSLPDKLREELPGVLAWAIRGCVEWVRGGLGTSAAVDAATAEYRSETDVTQRFFADECVFGEQYSVTRKALFQAWEKWALEEGVEPGTQTSFTRLVSERAKTLNVRAGKLKNTARVWRGIGLKSVRPDPDPEEVAAPEIPAKEQKIEDNGHFDENFPEVQSLPPNKGTSEKIDEKVSVVSVVSVPPVFEVDGYTVRFHGGEE